MYIYIIYAHIISPTLFCSGCVTSSEVQDVCRPLSHPHPPPRAGTTSPGPVLTNAIEQVADGVAQLSMCWCQSFFCCN